VQLISDLLRILSENDDTSPRKEVSGKSLETKTTV
jgi:hypothetical protein